MLVWTEAYFIEYISMKTFTFGLKSHEHFPLITSSGLSLQVLARCCGAELLKPSSVCPTWLDDSLSWLESIDTWQLFVADHTDILSFHWDR
jgi:hypothetical protein